MKLTNLVSELLILFSGMVSLSYYNSLYTRKKDIMPVALSFVLGYLILALIFLLGKPMINLIMFMIVNCVLTYLYFNASKISLVFNALILTAMMMISEYLFMMISQRLLGTNVAFSMDENSIIIHGIGSKFIFMIVILAFKVVFSFIKKDYTEKEMLYLVAMPLTTAVLLLFTRKVIYKLDKDEITLLFVAVIVILFANLFCFLIYDSILRKNRTVLELRDVVHNNELVFKDYQIIEQRYNTAKVIEHDINKHFLVLKSLIDENTNEAKEYLEKLICDKNKKSNIINLTNSKVFNIIISEKADICKSENIEFDYDIRFQKLNFIDDNDIVSIFSNLLDNAVESCRISKYKKINLSIFVVNENFLTVTLKNSSDNKPVFIRNKLQTIKKNRDKHGFGIISIKEVLKKYNGELDMKYDEDNKIFNSILIIPLS